MLAGTCQQARVFDTASLLSCGCRGEASSISETVTAVVCGLGGRQTQTQTSPPLLCLLSFEAGHDEIEAEFTVKPRYCSETQSESGLVLRNFRCVAWAWISSCRPFLIQTLARKAHLVWVLLSPNTTHKPQQVKQFYPCMSNGPVSPDTVVETPARATARLLAFTFPPSRA